MKSNVSKLIAESRLFGILLLMMVVLHFMSDRFLTVDNPVSYTHLDVYKRQQSTPPR